MELMFLSNPHRHTNPSSSSEQHHELASTQKTNGEPHSLTLKHSLSHSTRTSDSAHNTDEKSDKPNIKQAQRGARLGDPVLSNWEGGGGGGGGVLEAEQGYAGVRRVGNGEDGGGYTGYCDVLQAEVLLDAYALEFEGMASTIYLPHAV